MLRFDGIKLRQLRKAAGLQRSGLAAKSKIGRNTVRDLEQGKYSPSGETLVKLVDALGCTLDQLHSDGPSSELTPEERSSRAAAIAAIPDDADRDDTLPGHTGAGWKEPPSDPSQPEAR